MQDPGYASGYLLTMYAKHTHHVTIQSLYCYRLAVTVDTIFIIRFQNYSLTCHRRLHASRIVGSIRLILTANV